MATLLRPRTEALSNRSAAEPVRLKLQIIAGPDFGGVLVLDRGTYRIGKDAAGDLAIHDASVLLHLHLLAEVLGHGVRLTDQSSTNGSFCEGMRFTSLDVRPGATVRIGRTVLKATVAAAELRAGAPALEEGALRRAGRQHAVHA